MKTVKRREKIDIFLVSVDSNHLIISKIFHLVYGKMYIYKIATFHLTLSLSCIVLYKTLSIEYERAFWRWRGKKQLLSSFVIANVIAYRDYTFYGKCMLFRKLWLILHIIRQFSLKLNETSMNIVLFFFFSEIRKIKLPKMKKHELVKIKIGQNRNLKNLCGL